MSSEACCSGLRAEAAHAVKLFFFFFDTRRNTAVLVYKALSYSTHKHP